MKEEHKKIFLAAGLEIQGRILETAVLPTDRRLIYSEYTDGSHAIRDTEPLRRHLEAARIIDGRIRARVLDFEGCGREYWILGTFPEREITSGSPVPVTYTEDGNLSPDFEEAW